MDKYKYQKRTKPERLTAFGLVVKAMDLYATGRGTPEKIIVFLVPFRYRDDISAYHYTYALNMSSNVRFALSV